MLMTLIAFDIVLGRKLSRCTSHLNVLIAGGLNSGSTFVGSKKVNPYATRQDEWTQ